LELDMARRAARPCPCAHTWHALIAGQNACWLRW